MAARGYAVYVYDLRGHGQSSGTRGQVGRFDDYLDDTAIFLDEVRRRQPGKPLLLLGHSLGGLICARLAEERPWTCAALVLSSPFFALTDAALSRMKLLGAKVLSVVWPGRDIGNTVRAERPLARRRRGRGLRHRPAGAPRGARRAGRPRRWRPRTPPWPARARVTLPLLVLYGTDDQVADPAFAEAFFAAAGSADKKLVQLRGLLPRALQRGGPRRRSSPTSRPGSRSGCRPRWRRRAGLTARRSAERERRLGGARSPGRPAVLR